MSDVKYDSLTMELALMLAWVAHEDDRSFGRAVNRLADHAMNRVHRKDMQMRAKAPRARDRMAGILLATDSYEVQIATVETRNACYEIWMTDRVMGEHEIPELDLVNTILGYLKYHMGMRDLLCLITPIGKSGCSGRSYARHTDDYIPPAGTHEHGL